MTNKGICTALAVLILTAAIGGCGNTADSSSTPAEEKKTPAGVMRGLSAEEYAKEMGIGENLGNTFEAYWSSTGNKTSGASTIGQDVPLEYEKCWGAVMTTEDCIDGMENAGFSTVRIPVYWGNMMEDDGTDTVDSDYIARVQEVVDWVLDDGMYAVINIHHYDEYLIKNKPREEAEAAAKAVWEQVAEYFKDYSDYLIFEGYNENLGSHRDEDSMTEEEIYSYVNEMNQIFVDTVRATGGNNSQRLLIASGYWTNIDKTSDERFHMPEDSAKDKLMVSVHYIDNAMYWTNNIGGPQWEEYSKGQCEELKAAFTDKGIPVFVGECTSIYEPDRFSSSAEITESSEALRYMMDMAADYGFVPVLWDVNDNFYSRTECKIKSDSDAEVVKATADKITA